MSWWECAVCQNQDENLQVCDCKSMYFCSDEHRNQLAKSHQVLCKEVQEARKNGYVKTILKAGNGDKPKIGTQVTVHYVGTLVTGEKFDSSRDKGRPFKFNLGKGQVIKGWDEGVATMSVGEHVRLVLSSSYAYGEGGVEGLIPPNATLVFDVELLSYQ